MCGRFALTTPHGAIAELFGAETTDALSERLGNAGPRYNVCPTTQIAAIRLGEDGGRELTALRWGFIPRWYKSPTDGPLLINARSETIAEKPAFRAACRARRCLIPADGFYEWLREGERKRPFFVPPAEPREPPVVCFAAIWETWRGPEGEAMEACAIVTTDAGPDIRHIHDREPVTIREGDEGLWLGEKGKGAATLMHAAPEGFWAPREVSPKVNSNRAEGPELIEPLEA
ncbi:MAG: SOS response-associated peptidase [Paracoccaceae bacterium]